MQHQHRCNRNHVRNKVHPLKHHHPDTNLTYYQIEQLKPHTHWHYQWKGKSAYLHAKDVIERVHGLFHLFASILLQGAPHAHIKVEEKDLKGDVEQDAAPGHRMIQLSKRKVPLVNVWSLNHAINTVADKSFIDKDYAEKGSRYEGQVDFLLFEWKFFHEKARLLIIHERADWLGHFYR